MTLRMHQTTLGSGGLYRLAFALNTRRIFRSYRPGLGRYVLLAECLCTTACATHVFKTENVDPFSFARKCLFFGFFLHVYEN